jgi:hypothetical protein
MLSLLKFRLYNEKIRQCHITRPLKKASVERRAHAANLKTKIAVVPALLQFRLDFIETEILGDLQGIGN